MPHLIREVEGTGMEKEAKASPPFGPGFTDEQVKKADKLEVWGSCIDEAGGDYTWFALRKNGVLIAGRKQGGY